LTEVVGLLLAAGAAKRFGSDKLLHLLPHDVPLAVQSVRHLKAVCERIVVVVNPGSAKLSKLFEAEHCEIIQCNNASDGMGASLACGVRALNDAKGCLVALADMPFIRPSTIAAVRDALLAGAPLVAPYFHARRGHPVGIAGRFFAEMKDLTGDEGAKKILEKHKKDLLKIPVGDPGVLRDIDRPEDLAPPIVV
jgi:molybdenum cofactor cytidylyltransferase